MLNERSTSSAILDREIECQPEAACVSQLAQANQARPTQPESKINRTAQTSDKPAGNEERPWPTWLVSVTIVATTILHAIPWLVDGAMWSGWLGIATALALVRSRGLGSRLWVNWLWCTVALGIAFHWSPAAMAYTLSSGIVLGTIVALPLIIWDGLRLALGYWIASRITRDLRTFWLVAALTTIACEYAMPGVFPWKLGLVQLSVPWLIQGVDVFGPSYSTLVAFAFGGAIQICATHLVQYIALRRTNARVESSFNQKIEVASKPSDRQNRLGSSRLLYSPVLLFLVGNALYSTISWQYWSSISQTAPTVDVGMIQVDPSYVESIDNARELTNQVAEQVDLVCWPESSGGNYDLQLASLADEDRNFAMSREPERGLRPWPTPNCELLLGGKNYVGGAEVPDELYVTAMLIDRGENIVGRYNKRFLMPFGEYVPAESYIPGMASLFDMAEHIKPGSDARPISSTTGARIGTMLCYEDMVPQASRQMVTSGSNVLISLINGSAFESPFTLYQHRMISHLRSIECRRYFLRCAATGETCVINPLGLVEAKLPMQTNDMLISHIGLIEGRTVYSRYPWLLPLLGSLTLAFLLQRRQRHSLSV